MPNEKRNRFHKILDGLFRHHPKPSHDRMTRPRWWKRSAPVESAQVTTAQPHSPSLSTPASVTHQPGGSAHRPIAVLSGHTGIVRGIAWFPDGKRVVTCSDDRSIRVWKTKGGRAKILVENELHTSIAMFPKGDKTASGCNGKVKVLNCKSGRLLHEGAGHSGELLCVAISPNGQFIASGARDGRIMMRETMNGSIHRVFGERDWTSAVFKVAFSPDGTRIASAHSQAKIQAFDVGTGKIIFGPTKHDPQLAYDVRGLVWSLDGRQLISACRNTIRKWDVDARVPVDTPKRYSGWISSISLSPDGTRLACTSGTSVCFANFDSLQQIGEPLQHNGLVITVAFSPTGDFIASGGWDHKISIWRVPPDTDIEAKGRLDPVVPHSSDLSATANLEQPKVTQISHTQSSDNMKAGDLAVTLAPPKSSPSRPLPSRSPRRFRQSEDVGLSGLRPGDWW